jgi:SulP family sulfate permease
LVVVTVLIATPLVELLPKVALAAIIVVAVTSLIDVRGARAIWRIRRSDLLSLAVAFGATLILGPAPGLLTGVAISLVLFLRHSARPHMPELGLKVDDGAYRNRTRHDVVVLPGLVVLRIDAPLSFTGARPIAERIAEVVRGRPDTTLVVIDCSAINTADFTGIEMLSTLRDELDASGVALHLAALRGPVWDILRRDPVYSHWEPRIHPTVPAAVTTLTG